MGLVILGLLRDPTQFVVRRDAVPPIRRPAPAPGEGPAITASVPIAIVA